MSPWQWVYIGLYRHDIRHRRWSWLCTSWLLVRCLSLVLCSMQWHRLCTLCLRSKPSSPSPWRLRWLGFWVQWLLDVVSFDRCNAFKVVVRMFAFDMFDAFVHVFAIFNLEEHDLMCLPVFHDDAVALVHVVGYRYWGKRIGATEVTPVCI